jgi:predicted permease
MLPILRSLWKNPGFALTAIATIALGIGASTAIFSVADAVVFRPLPYPDSNRLTLVLWENRTVSSRSLMYSNADFFDLRDGTREIFSDIGGLISFRSFDTREDGSADQVAEAVVTTNCLRLLGAKVALGRDFTDAEAAPRSHAPGTLFPPGNAAILSDEYWRRRYGARTDIIGTKMPSGPVIVGVLARGFRLYFPPSEPVDREPDYYVANNYGYDAAHRNLITAIAIGKLRPGLTLASAQQRLNALRPAIRKNSFDPDATLRLEPMGRYLADAVRPAILALAGAVAFLLLTACANVGNLMMVRASARERELAVRAALGGSWWRLAEAAAIAVAGTAVGVALAWAGIRGLLALAPPDIPRFESAAIDWHVLLFAAAAGAFATTAFGMIPALRSSRPDLNRVLRGARGAMEGHMLRNAVVIVEVALSFALLVGSGLMARSFLTLRRVDPGFDPRGVLTFYVTRQWELPRQEGRIELLTEIQSRLRALPGVESASAALALPLGGGIGVAAAAGRTGWQGVQYQQVMPDYFETLHTRLIAGRTFDAHDNRAGHPVAIIDEQFAEHAFPDRSAVGQRVHLPGDDNPRAEVIGVVAHQRLASLAAPGRDILFLADGGGSWGVGVSRYWMVRTKGDPAQLAPEIRAALARLDNQLVISKVQPLTALVDRDQAATRFELILTGAFAVMALLLAAVGLYGVLAAIVRQRTAEIGVRMALGAEPASIFRLVVGHGIRLSIFGLVIGWVAAIALTRIMAAMLVGVTPTDPVTFTAMTGLFLAISAAACWIPASRAAGVDPMAALRE